jgi:TctA family transporter
MSKGNAAVFFTRPISLGFLIATALIVVIIVLPAVRSRRGEIAG